MADATFRLSAVAKRLHLLQEVAGRWDSYWPSWSLLPTCPTAMGHVCYSDEAAAAARNCVSSGLTEPIVALCRHGLRSASASAFGLSYAHKSSKVSPYCPAVGLWNVPSLGWLLCTRREWPDAFAPFWVGCFPASGDTKNGSAKSSPIVALLQRYCRHGRPCGSAWSASAVNFEAIRPPALHRPTPNKSSKDALNLHPDAYWPRCLKRACGYVGFVKTKRYPTDLTDSQWFILQHLIHRPHEVSPYCPAVGLWNVPSLGSASIDAFARIMNDCLQPVSPLSISL